ncbi:hypothetical protein CCAN11_2300011 [Capnocytophaga canimorsus]|uniref:Cyclic nucleotide-binding domain-containing protein n=1 Tax=Capnocytophaga canimorsus TaxID=28188 RepID=A0A0B7IHR0_9FLAO|nr:hypothetical protein [Capnocytophaga canimorsus]CEN51400.1 hypothetical protein CCAN11_2300011 [Capnocytophaga canimorsus]
MLSSDIFKNPIFRVLSSRERAVFQANTTYLKFEEEEMFIKEGSMLFSVYFIVQGMVKGFATPKNGFSGFQALMIF